MREKDQHTNGKATPDADKKDESHLSDSIANAHASGDGAIERGKDSLLDVNDSDAEPDEIKPGENESY